MEIQIRCSECGDNIGATTTMVVDREGKATIDMLIQLCPSCFNSPQAQSIASVALVDFLKSKTLIDIAFVKRNGAYRVINGRFTGFNPTKSLLYVWDDDEDSLKAVRLRSVDKVTVDGVTYEVTGGCL